MTREYRDWERCSLNMSGIHTWTIVKVEPERKRAKMREAVRCHRCGTEPPTMHRARIFEEIKAALEVEKNQRDASQAWRQATGR